ncbi:MAG: hypothetical protein COW24_00705 [Candidatus Kerfeldbacteria bacterium CG15_BIG_FIL_POST_REV_8_21_14_020_45_12]|uniref:Uncharacterized protein n=1 Tax=Candidatus Kerfeldbacteria bacterium CG15_BIG_FIL_POST_REV_8_21_14_020_45_12 TaxID=2014247 RepID=A0A2M7H521_9BACT|nr:MAG: hypothetical protein COW24_00705 [Candidatus Kerfeldbacteria bacterium CG15_BIG_FIL_POST_REV_8_21_14_020_45_12]PJA93138.1 MAG: hypothetical protein CO132_04525 [Candidatus Kerfeldbacteria bacterium CG_4_9_14_3_um_filter_45_8]
MKSFLPRKERLTRQESAEASPRAFSLDTVKAMARPDSVMSRSRWLATAAAALALTVSEPVQANEAVGPVMVEQAGISPEAGAEDASKRLKEAFAAVGEQLDDPLFRNMPEAKRVRAVELLSKFPVERSAAIMAELSGVSEEEILNGSALERVVVYSPTWLDKNQSSLAQLAGYTSVSPESLEQWKGAAGFTTGNGKLIGINLDLLVNILHDGEFSEGVAEVAMHEFVHALVYDSVYDERFTDLDRLAHEGGVQVFALEIIKRLNPKVKLLDTGYDTGVKQAGYLIANELGSEFMFNSIVTDDHAALAGSWNNKFGEQSWEKAMAFEFGTEDVNTVRDLYPLFGLMDQMGPAAASASAEVNRSMANSRVLPLFDDQSGNLEALYIRDDRMEYGVVSGLTRVAFELPNGHPMILVMYLPEEQESLTASGTLFMGHEVAVAMSAPIKTQMPLVGAVSDADLLILLDHRLERKVEDIKAASISNEQEVGE